VVTIKKAQEHIVDVFAGRGDWFDRYEYLIALGRSLAPLDERYKTEEYALGGCQSQVWIRAELEEGFLHIEADSDSLITRGILALLVKVVDRQPPGEIAAADLFFLKDIGLSTNLSPSRANGLELIVRRIRSLAREFAARS
jgi:cysteine desulfuration protein SufE